MYSSLQERARLIAVPSYDWALLIGPPRTSENDRFYLFPPMLRNGSSPNAGPFTIRELNRGSGKLLGLVEIANNDDELRMHQVIRAVRYDPTSVSHANTYWRYVQE